MVPAWAMAMTTANRHHAVISPLAALAKEMVAEQFAELAQHRVPTLEMPNGDVLYVSYNREKDTLDVGTAANGGLAVQHSFAYNHHATLDGNMQEACERLESMEECDMSGLLKKLPVTPGRNPVPGFSVRPALR